MSRPVEGRTGRGRRDPSPAKLSITAINAVDSLQCDAAVLSVLTDVPDAVVVRHDLTGADAGRLRRVVSDGTGLLEQVEVPLDHACLSCALREDLLPTLVELAAQHRWSAAVVALPTASEPIPLVRAMAQAEVHGRSVTDTLHLAGIITVVDPEQVVEDLVGIDTLADRGLAHGAGDERAVGEVLAHQLTSSDLVLAGAGPTANSAGTTMTRMVPTWLLDEPTRHGGVAQALLQHLTDPAALNLRAGPSDVSGHDLLLPRHDTRRSAAWEDPRFVEPTGAADGRGVWTLDLRDWRPMHPGRFLDHLEDLGVGRLVGRGRFWLPSRVQTVGVWDNAGGQLSVGSFGGWGETRPSTRLVVTGVGEDPRRVRDAFTASLLTDAELARGLEAWDGRPDGFEDWMGDVLADEDVS